MKTKALFVSGLIALSLPTALFAAADPGMNNQIPPMNQTPTAPAPTPAPKPKPVSVKQAAPSVAPEPVVNTTADSSSTPPAAIAIQAAPSGDAGKTPYALYAMAAVVLVAFASWIRKWLEGLKKAGLAGGTKAEEKKPCERCGGKGTVTEKHVKTVKCSHCKGSGQDPCHNCGGTGKMTMPNPAGSEEELENWPPCDFCGGSGKHRLGAGRDWGEANEAMAAGIGCCMCHGRKTESYTETSEVPCPVCHGKK